MNLLELDGPTFIGVFAALLIVAFGLARVVHAQTGPRGSATETELAALSVADVGFLTDGAHGALTAGLANLSRRGQLAYALSSGVLKTTAPASAADGLFESMLHQALDGRSARFEVLATRVRPAIDAMRLRLIQEGFLLETSRRVAIGITSGALILPLVILGVIKIRLGIEFDRPVIFVILITFVSVVVLSACLFNPPRMTRKGADALEALRVRHAALQQVVLSHTTIVPPADLPLAVALFGELALRGTALSGLGMALNESNASSATDVHAA